MTQTFDCPSCGATLDYEGDEPIVRCAYCDSVAIVPESLRPQEPAREQQAWSAAPLSGAPLTVNLGELSSTIANLRTIKQLVKEGQEEKAARLYQETTGADVQEAEAVIQRLAAGQSVVLSSGPYTTSIPVVSGQRATVMIAEQIEATRERGRQINRVVTCVVIAIIAAILGFIGLFAAVGYLLR